MEQTKINYPIPAKFEGNSENSQNVVLVSIVASLCGASIPAVIFYFLM